MSGVPSSQRLYNLLEICQIIQQSRTTVFRLFKSGRLMRTKEGRRSFVSDADLTTYLDSMKRG